MFKLVHDEPVDMTGCTVLGLTWTAEIRASDTPSVIGQVILVTNTDRTRIASFAKEDSYKLIHSYNMPHEACFEMVLFLVGKLAN